MLFNKDKGLTEKVTFGQRPEGGRELWGYWGKCSRHREQPGLRPPGRKQQKASVAGVWPAAAEKSEIRSGRELGWVGGALGTEVGARGQLTLSSSPCPGCEHFT